MYDEKEVRYSKFIHSDLIHFSNDDLSRSIPSIVDGFKPSQRKILYGAYLRGLDKTEVKVAQLAGFVSDKAAYHHGEASLLGAIIGMAQNYMGSNNINILKPNGMFGCLAPNTPVIMWNGTIQQADSIVVNDELIGDDGNKRIVLKTVFGMDDMYQITNKYIENNFICNKDHILTLHYKDNNKIKWDKLNSRYYIEYFNGKQIKSFSVTTKYTNIDIYEKSNYTKKEAYNLILKRQYNTNKIIDIKVSNYLKLSEYYKSKMSMISNFNCINWNKKDVLNDPYILSKLILKDNNMQIPIEYIINDKENRLKLLAGFIDFEGCLNNNQYEIRQSNKINKQIIDSLHFIAKSLGFFTLFTDQKLLIMGNNIYEIPCINNRNQINKNILKKQNTLTSFNISYLGKNKFNGWQLDKNERFLLGNFIVTHNSRLNNGKDAASPRYIWTAIENIATVIFNKSDEPILPNQVEDNEPIEPEYYAPIIPMILVNGALGIGTGFATKIPCYDPIEIIENLKNKLNSKISNFKFKQMDPYWADFEGIIAKIDDYNYEIYGTYQINGNKLIITELPVGESTSGYKEFLEKLLEPENVVSKTPAKLTNKSKAIPKKVAKPKEVTFLGYTDNNTFSKVYFELEFVPGYLDTVKDIDKLFHLYKKYSITNMHLFDVNGKIKKYNSPVEIMDEFYDIRLSLYQKRKVHELDILDYQIKLISYKIKFIMLIIDKKLKINNKKKIDIENELMNLEFPKLGTNNDLSYNYLLSMPLYNLTTEKIEELKTQQSNKETTYKEFNALSIEDMWLNELNNLEEKYETFLKIKHAEAPIKHNKKKNKKNKL